MKIFNFLSNIKKDIGSGRVLEAYNRFDSDYLTVDVDETTIGDGAFITVYYKGDHSVGEGDLRFMSFDTYGTFTKLEDYDDMNEDLALDEVKKSIERNFHLLKNESKADTNISELVLELFDQVTSDIEKYAKELRTDYKKKFLERRVNLDYSGNDKKLMKIYAKIQDLETKFWFDVEELKKEVG